MADLTSIEKLKLEKFFKMESGYVLEFSNRTFRDYFLENCHIDIYDEKYGQFGDSKANRMRAFWVVESNSTVGKLISDMLNFRRAQIVLLKTEFTSDEQELFSECQKISERITIEIPFVNIDAINPNTDDKDFKRLAKMIRESIEKNEPEIALDRLHTFTVKYIRQLCRKHEVLFNKDTPLNSLIGGYIKFLRDSKKIESSMTETILRTSISVLEMFNKVRNDQSYAHDNPILNYSESILIFNSISNLIFFLEAIENKTNQTKAMECRSENGIL